MMPRRGETPTGSPAFGSTPETMSGWGSFPGFAPPAPEPEEIIAPSAAEATEPVLTQVQTSLAYALKQVADPLKLITDPAEGTPLIGAVTIHIHFGQPATEEKSREDISDLQAKAQKLGENQLLLGEAIKRIYQDRQPNAEPAQATNDSDKPLKGVASTVVERRKSKGAPQDSTTASLRPFRSKTKSDIQDATTNPAKKEERVPMRKKATRIVAASVLAASAVYGVKGYAENYNKYSSEPVLLGTWKVIDKIVPFVGD